MLEADIFIYSSSADQVRGSAGGQLNVENNTELRPILLNMSKILQIKVTLIHSVLYVK